MVHLCCSTGHQTHIVPCDTPLQGQVVQVAVKVRHPFVAQRIAQDFRCLKGLAAMVPK